MISLRQKKSLHQSRSHVVVVVVGLCDSSPHAWGVASVSWPSSVLLLVGGGWSEMLSNDLDNLCGIASFRRDVLGGVRGGSCTLKWRASSVPPTAESCVCEYENNFELF